MNDRDDARRYQGQGPLDGDGLGSFGDASSGPADLSRPYSRAHAIAKIINKVADLPPDSPLIATIAQALSR